MESRTDELRAPSGRSAARVEGEPLARPSSRTRLEREIELAESGAGAERAEALNARSILAFVEPELYERNAFRLLGLSTELARVPASHADAARTGGFGSTPAEGAEVDETSHRRLRLFPLAEPADDDTLDEARASLRQPHRRLLHELFWFWPQETGDLSDEALRLLERQEVKGCGQLWLRQEKQGHHDCVATHNLAILYHLSALNVERELATGDVDDRRYRFGVSCWGECLSRWARLLVHDGFWSRVRSRAEVYLGPLRGAEYTEKVREVLPRALLQIHVELAARALADDRFRDFQNHKRLVESCSLREFGSSDLVEEILRSRIDGVWEDCDRLEELGALLLDASDVGALLRETEERIDSIDRTLQLVDGLLRADSPERVLSHDRAARAVLQWLGKLSPAACLEIDLDRVVGRAIAWTGDPALRRSLQASARLARRWARLQACHFSGDPRPDPRSALAVWLHGDVRMEFSFQGGARRAWEERRVVVPRSRRARRLHLASRSCVVAAAGGTALALLASAIELVIGSAPTAEWLAATVDSLRLLGIVVGVCGLGGLSVTWALGRRWRIRPASAAHAYEPVAQLLASKWRRGRRPPRLRPLELA